MKISVVTYLVILLNIGKAKLIKEKNRKWKSWIIWTKNSRYKILRRTSLNQLMNLKQFHKQNYLIKYRCVRIVCRDFSKFWGIYLKRFRWLRWIRRLWGNRLIFSWGLFLRLWWRIFRRLFRHRLYLFIEKSLLLM